LQRGTMIAMGTRLVKNREGGGKRERERAK
jgi:hypothetical protein